MKKISAATASMLVALAISASAAQAGEEKTASGIVITTLKEGAGESPKPTSVVKVHYRGTLQNGMEFDSSYARGEPAMFPLNRVIRCWTEAVQTMKVGGSVRLVCPPNVAYGNHGIPGTIPPYATLLFEVELLEIVK